MRKEKIAVGFFALPGGGKGTQAEMVEKEFGLTSFDTGRHLEAMWNDPAKANDPIFQEQKKAFQRGDLNDPNIVLNVVARGTRAIAARGEGVLYSGSPRTVPEAEGLIPVLEELYGNRICFFFLEVDPLVAAARNGRRMTCRTCIPPLPPSAYTDKPLVECPRCGGELYRRKLDYPDKIPQRHREFRDLTVPVVKVFNDMGHPVFTIDGNRDPDEVFKQIVRHIERKLA